MTIHVVITSWCVPFQQLVNHMMTFNGEDEVACALHFINEEAKIWWDKNEGDRCVAESAEDETPQEPFTPFTDLYYDHKVIELWGGENGFHAMIDFDSVARLHEDYYRRKCDDQGKRRPGYLINAYLTSRPMPTVPLTDKQRAAYQEQHDIGMAEIEAHYRKPTKN